MPDGQGQYWDCIYSPGNFTGHQWTIYPAARADGYLLKPLQSDLLLGRVERVLQRA